MRRAGAGGEQHVYLAPQHEDGVDVREDAVKAEVDVRTDQRKNRRQDAGTRLELRRTTGHAEFIHSPFTSIIPLHELPILCLGFYMGGFPLGIYLRQDSIDGVPALGEHQVLVKHEVEGESLAEGVRADASLLRAVLLEAVQVLVESLFLRVLLLDQELDVVTLFALGLNHLQHLKALKSYF